jgi:hypothetical protein
MMYPQSSILNPSLYSSLMIMVLLLIILIVTAFKIPLMMYLLT